MDAKASGAFVYAKLFEEKAIELFDGIFARSRDEAGKKIAHKRIEYLLRTRTGIGYISKKGESADDLPDFYKKLKVILHTKFADGLDRNANITVGYYYPHLMVSKKAKITDPKRADLFYNFIDESFIKGKMRRKKRYGKKRSTAT